MKWFERKYHNGINRILRILFKGRLTHSQAGEDMVLSFLFNTKGISQPSYIDIGANLPDESNNTYLFYKKGGNGVCIEPDPISFIKLKNKRKRDVCLNDAIGLESEGEIDFYIFSDSQLNTLSKEEAEYRASFGNFKIEKIIKINQRKLNDLIPIYFSTYPDLVSLDVEGIDLDVLKSIDFEKFPIPVFCVETVGYSENHIKEKDHNLIDFMLSKGYFVYGDTYINTIFVNKDWFYS